MLSPPFASSSGGGGASRRSRYTRSPSPGIPSSKRLKPSNSSDAYERKHSSGSDQARLYTSICVKNINPKISDLEIRELCNTKFSKYGTNSVKIYHKNQERVAFVNFTNCEDAKKARHAKTGLVWDDMRVLLEPVYYRRTVPAEKPISPSSPPQRSPLPQRRHRRPSPPSPSPPPFNPRSYQSSRYRRSRSPRQPSPPPPSRSTRPPRRHYSPFIPLPPDLREYVSSKSSGGQRVRSPPSPVRRHKPSPAHRRSYSASPPPPAPSHRARRDGERSNHGDKTELTRTLLVDNLERDVSDAKIEELFGRYGTIEQIDLKKSQATSKRLCATIRYENVDMAYQARRAMDGHPIGKAECKISYGV